MKVYRCSQDGLAITWRQSCRSLVLIVKIFTAFALSAFGSPLWDKIPPYRFDKDVHLVYSLDLDTKYFGDPNDDRRFVPIRSHYSVEFHALSAAPEGDAIIAAVARLESVSVPEGGPGTAKKEDVESVSDWMASFQKEAFSAFRMDAYGNIVKGSMVWPRSACYHFAAALSSFALGEKGNGGFASGWRPAGVEKNGDAEESVYYSEGPGLKMMLRVDVARGLPVRLESQYSYITLRRRLAENFRMTLIRCERMTEEDVVKDDPAMLGATLVAARLFSDFDIGAEIVRRAISSSDPKIRLLAAAYLADHGIPEGFSMEAGLSSEDDAVGFNLAKARFWHEKNRKALEKYLKSSISELKARAASLLSAPAESREDFLKFLSSFKSLPSMPGEAEVYGRARAVLSTRQGIPHLGPRTCTLSSGLSGKRIFRYNIALPLDYDPAEKYPLLIHMAGGNGFSEGMFLGILDILPRDYIVVCPDAAYGLWWESDQIQMFDDLLTRLLRDYAVDPDRVYLMGFSNGGVAAYLHGYHHADRFAAIAALMGFSKRTDKDRELETELSLNLKNTPILIIHGDRDRIIDVRFDRRLADFLRLNGIPHTYLELPGVGHEVTFDGQRREIMDFFRKRKRAIVPESINLIVDEPRYNRNFWIRVDEKQEDNERAVVKADRKNNRFIVSAENVARISLLLNDAQAVPGRDVEVVLNKKIVFRGPLKLDPAALFESLVYDRDPARIYGLKLTFDVAKR